ncbi:MAG: uroporphyrinogen-III synthase [Bacteroidales bacterium]|nr:uroporphyrinogen-III synthase [Bacteroidales bacterium]OJX91311.1 MAG: uroporphyrinogen-III synthase [Paludibacter sp. 47-17]
MKIKKILVSQPQPQGEKSPYFDISEKHSVKIDFRPFIKVEGLSAKEFRAQRVSILDYTAIIFIAKQGIDHFFKICEEMRITIPETMKYFCVTESVAVYLQHYIHYRKRKVFFGTSTKMSDLVPVLNKHTAEKYLFVAPEIVNEETLHALEGSKIKYTKAVMYRTVSNDFGPDEEFNYDMLLFFSPLGVQSLLKNFPDFKQEEIQIGCFGTTTAAAVRELGLRLDLEAPSPQYPSMTMALDAFLRDYSKKKK